MPYFREEDIKRKQNSWNEEAHNVLVLAIQTIDKLGLSSSEYLTCLNEAASGDWDDLSKPWRTT